MTADIIFVHGLMGGPFKTWRQGKREKPKAELPQLLLPSQPPPPPPVQPPVEQKQQEDNTDSEQSNESQDEGENIETNTINTMKQLAVRAQYMIHQLSLKLGGRVGSVVTRRAIDLKVRGSSPAHGGSRIAG